MPESHLEQTLAEPMALQLIRPPKSLDLVTNLVNLLVNAVDSRICFLFTWRSITGTTQKLTTDFGDFKQRKFFHPASFFKKRDFDSQPQQEHQQFLVNEVSQVRRTSPGSTEADVLARYVGDRKLTPEIVLEIVKRLRHDPETAFSFYRWAGSRNFYVHDTRVFNEVVGVLVSANRLGDVDVVLEEMIRKSCHLDMETAVKLVTGYANAGMVDRALAIYTEVVKRKGDGGFLPAHVYNSVLSAMERQQRFGEADEVVGELLGRGFVPGESTCDVLVRIFCKSGAVEKAVWLLSWLPGKGVHVPAMTLSMVIDGLCKVGREEVAVELFEGTSSTWRSVSDSAFICCSLICGIFRTGELVKASRMIRELAQRGLISSSTLSGFTFPEAGQTFSFLEIISMLRALKVGLSTFEYNCFIEGLCKAEKLEEAQLVYELMRENEIPADSYTHNYMIECISKGGRVEEAQKLLGAMEQSECKPDVFTYTRIINGFCKLGKFESALLLLRRMKDAGCSPDVVTFDCIISGLSKASNFEDALKLLKVSIEIGCEPDEVTYISIIDPLCKLEDWESALKVFEMAKKRNCPGSIKLYSRLMNCLCKTGKVEEACQILQDLTNGERTSEYHFGENRCEPDLVVYSIVVDGLCGIGKIEEAFVLVKVMEDRGIKPDVVTYTSFLHAFCGSGRLDKACKLLEMMVKADCNPDVYAYNTLIASLCSAEREEEAYGLFEVMVESGCAPDAFTFSRLITVLCRAKKMEAAMHLFNYMKRARCVPELVVYKELVYGHYRLGKAREARKLLEQESKAFSMSNPGKSLVSELHENAGFVERKQLSSIIS